MNERFKEIINAIGLKNKELAKELGVTPAAVSDIVNGRVKKISGSLLIILEIKYKVNPTWLLTGEGKMFIPKSSSVTKGAEIKEPGELEGIKGGAEEIDVDIDHVKWFRKLSRKKQTAILAIAEIEDEEYIDEVKGSTLFKLRQQRDIQKAGAENEGAIRKKGEAG